MWALIARLVAPVAAKILSAIVKKMSSDVRGWLVSMVKELEVKAKATPNPWDDIAVTVLKAIVKA